MSLLIYTVTLNPSLDYVMNVDKFIEGVTNRSKKEEIYIGGKGINVSIVLKNMGIESTALGFVAGFTGEYILKKLNEYKILNDFIYLQNCISRINIKLKTMVESEINANGPEYSKKDIESLMKKIKSLEDDDYLVLAGSIPKTLPSDIYSEIMKELKSKDIKIVVDATKNLLLNVLKYKPFLIKPNLSELQELFDIKIEKDEDIIRYSKELIKMGAQNVIISMGKDGAIFINNNISIKLPVPKGILKNSVGAGDSMVAGFIYGYITTKDYEKSFTLAVACGSATAFSDKLATKKEVDELYKQIQKNTK